MPPSPITSTSVYRPAMTVPIPSLFGALATRGAGGRRCRRPSWHRDRAGRTSPVAPFGPRYSVATSFGLGAPGSDASVAGVLPGCRRRSRVALLPQAVPVGSLGPAVQSMVASFGTWAVFATGSAMCIPIASGSPGVGSGDVSGAGRGGGGRGVGVGRPRAITGDRQAHEAAGAEALWGGHRLQSPATRASVRFAGHGEICSWRKTIGDRRECEPSEGRTDREPACPRARRATAPAQ